MRRNTLLGIAAPRVVALLTIACLAPLFGPSASAQAPSSDPIRIVRWTAGDVMSFSRSLVKPRTLVVVGAAGGAALLLSGLDVRVTQGAIDLAEKAPPRARRVINEFGNVNVVRPMALVFFLGTLTSGDERLQDAAFTSFEAIVLSNIITNILKTAVGRARPNMDAGAHSFHPFSGSRSFPSGHATTVFAFTTPWLLYYPHFASAALFALGAGTAFLRMADNHHWLTDVLAGGAIGFGAGYLLSLRHLGDRARLAVRPVAGPRAMGLAARVRL